MTAIRTEYKGINFRSRLEATWAAFFDQIGWEWEYEPCDFDGWIPDFGLIKKDGSFLYVEVKPFMTEEEWQTCDKIKQFDFEILCLNATPIVEYNEFYIGYIANECWGYAFDRVLLCDDEYKKDYDFKYKYDFTVETGSFEYRLNQIHDGDHHVNYAHAEYIKLLWNHAKNITQWKPF